MTVSADEFLRRFLLHVLPGWFTRIRYFGFLANRCRAVSLELCRKLLGQTEAVEPEPVGSLKLPTTWPCPHCSQAMMFVERLSAAQALRYLNTAVGFNSS